MILVAAVYVAQLADSIASLVAIGRYGAGVEVNPIMGALFALGPLAFVGGKLAVVTVVVYIALNNKYGRALLAITAALGVVGALSALVALAA